MHPLEVGQVGGLDGGEGLQHRLAVRGQLGSVLEGLLGPLDHLTDEVPATLHTGASVEGVAQR
ncbi:MAG: hypothetical protein DI571_04315, partial [Arsenicicoccus sp.]